MPRRTIAFSVIRFLEGCTTMVRKAHITTRQQLLTDTWVDDVRDSQMHVTKLSAGHTVTYDCGIMFFEMAGDRELHVNVTHKHKTASATGWSGPGVTPEGFVHNRRFAAAAAPKSI